MPIIPRLRSLARNLFKRSVVDRALDDELEQYADLLATEHRARGLSDAEARRAARLAIGGVQQVKEEVGDVRAGAFIETLAQDLRLALRGLRRSVLFTAASIATLAVGIASTTVVFGVVDAAILHPLHYRDSDRLVVVLHGGMDPVSPTNYLDWRSRSRLLPDMEAAEHWTPTITGGEPERVTALRVTPGLIAMLGEHPTIGRGFNSTDPRDDRREVVISYSLWQRRFGGDSTIVGRTVDLGGEPYRIVGVMGPQFHFAPFWVTDAELWGPLPLGSRASGRDGNSLRVFARLAPAATIDAAQREMTTITARLEAEFPETNKNVRVVSLTEKAVGNTKPAVLTLLAATLFVLLITCTNVGHMLLTRGASRRKEIALRTVLGAPRGRIVRQLVTESSVLALAGGALGLGLAFVATQIVSASIHAEVSSVRDIPFDGRLALVGASITVVAGLIAIGFGVLPALIPRESTLGADLREGARGSTESGAGMRLRLLLVGSEIAFAVILLVGTGLMVRTFAAMRAIDPGFDPRGVITMQVPIAPSAAGTPGQRAAYYTRLVETLGAIPTVRDVSAINHLPLAGDEWGVQIYGGVTANVRAGAAGRSIFRVILPDYFKTMRIEMPRGRSFTPDDDLAHPAVAVVNERLAATLWPGQDPIGKQLSRSATGTERNWVTVIGVARDTRQSQWTAIPDPEIYFPCAQDLQYFPGPSGGSTQYLTMVVRATGDQSPVVRAVRGYVRRSAPTLAVTDVQTMASVVNDATARARLMMSILTAFGAVALGLAGLGIYAVMSFGVAQRTHEIGIRMALGARTLDVLRSVLAHGAIAAGVGVATGFAGALLLTRVIAAQLYGVRAVDPITYASVTVVLSIVALLASSIPARRAARIDPLRAIQNN
jgi:predicted permease